MGANYIHEFVSTDQAAFPNEACRMLHARDRDKHGNGSYTGSWAEVPGVVRAPGIKRPMILSEAYRAVQVAFGGAGGPRKWEVGHFLDVFEPETSSERKVAVRLDDAARRACGVRSAGFDLGELARRVPLHNGEQIVSVEVGPTASKRTVKVAAGAGRVETRYFVVRNGELDPTWDTGHASQAEARAALDAWLRASDHRHPDADRSGEVVAIRRRADGTGLVTGENRITRSTTPVTVTVARPGSHLAGWLLYAVASC